MKAEQYHRHPRGKTQAIRNDARKGSIPPDAWDDIPNKAQKQWFNYSNRLPVMKMTFEEFYSKMSRKFPTLVREDIRFLYYTAKKHFIFKQKYANS